MAIAALMDARDSRRLGCTDAMNGREQSEGCCGECAHIHKMGASGKRVNR